MKVYVHGHQNVDLEESYVKQIVKSNVTCDTLSTEHTIKDGRTTTMAYTVDGSSR